MVLPPSQWAVELDDRDVLQADAGKDVVGSGKAKAPAGAKVNKAAKGAKGKSKGAKQQPPEENADAGDLEKKPAVVAQFSDDGTVVGLWCRCAQDAEVSEACTPLRETCPISWSSMYIVPCAHPGSDPWARQPQLGRV